MGQEEDGAWAESGGKRGFQRGGELLRGGPQLPQKAYFPISKPGQKLRKGKEKSPCVDRGTRSFTSNGCQNSDEKEDRGI